uniref:Plant thionin family protein n=1 Tax=Brassica campestris TaxID=3711 RepID=M4F281_BRACM
MGKVMSMVWIMMILAVLVIGGEAKSEIECSKICRPHCQRSSPASECAACSTECYKLPQVAMRGRNRRMVSEDPKQQ